MKLPARGGRACWRRLHLIIALAALAQAACRDVSRLANLGRALNDEFAPTRLGLSLTDQVLLSVTVGDSVRFVSMTRTVPPVRRQRASNGGARRG